MNVKKLLIHAYLLQQGNVTVIPMQCNSVPHTGAICCFLHPHEWLKVVLKS